MSGLFIGLMAGVFGMAYMMYGRRQSRPVAFISGLLLCIYPWATDSVPWLLGIGGVLLAAPFVIDI
jgi:hypothetical protein